MTADRTSCQAPSSRSWKPLGVARRGAQACIWPPRGAWNTGRGGVCRRAAWHGCQSTVRAREVPTQKGAEAPWGGQAGGAAQLACRQADGGATRGRASEARLPMVGTGSGKEKEETGMRAQRNPAREPAQGEGLWPSEDTGGAAQAAAPQPAACCPGRRAFSLPAPGDTHQPQEGDGTLGDGLALPPEHRSQTAEQSPVIPRDGSEGSGP